MDNSDDADGGTDSEPVHSVDLDDYPDGTAEVLGTIHLNGPYQVGDGISRGEISRSTDLSKSQVRVRAQKLVENDLLVEQRVDVGQAHPEARYSVTGEAKEVAAACAESFDLFGEVPDDPGQDEFLQVLSHVSRLRREDGVEEEARSLGTLVERVSELEDRMDVAEDDREVLHSRDDKGLEWMRMALNAITDAVDGVEISRCNRCGEYANLYNEGMNYILCEDCR